MAASNTSPQTVGFLGTGLIGAAMAESLLRRKEGSKVRVYNRSADKTKPLVDLGAIAGSPREAVAKADRVHMAFPNDAVVDSVLAEVASDLGAAVVVDHSTTSVALTAARAARCEAEGIQYLHAPVFMSPGSCLSSEGMMVVAGPNRAYQSVESALGAMTGEVWYLGEQTERATAFKLFGNGMILAMLGGLSDAFAMADAFGVDRGDVLTLVERLNPEGNALRRGARMAKGDFEPAWSLSMARKDIGLMIDPLGDTPTAVLGGLAARMDQLIDEEHGEQDVGVIATRKG